MMSEETNKEQALRPTGEKWGDPIDETRKQELWTRLRAWWEETDHGERKGPFAGERLTGAEVFWLAVCALAQKESKLEAQAEQRLRNPNLFNQDDPLPIDLSLLCLQEADLSDTRLEQAILSDAQLWNACFYEAYLQGADLSGAQLQESDLTLAQLQGANLQGANLEQTIFREAQLQEARLMEVQAEQADFQGAQLQGADLTYAALAGANLSGSFFDGGTSLRDVSFSTPEIGCVQVADVRWGDVNLAVLDGIWLPPLGDEQMAHMRTSSMMESQQLKLYRAAARANRQLSAAMQNQGMNEQAGEFAYHAQLMQRTIYRQEGNWGRYLFSWFLWLVAGYGYRPLRSFLAYLVIIMGFMGLYLLNAHFVAPHLTWDEALVLSVSSFHGRGFFSQNITLGDTYARLAALEAVFGLLIEISFIATFTQRFFGSK